MPERMQQRVQVSTIRQASVYLATVTVFLDVFLLIPSFAFYVYQVLELGTLEYGMISASYSLFRMVGVLFFGWMADKFGRRPPLIIGSGVVALSLFMFPQIPAAASALIPFILLNCIRGFFAGGATPSIHALVADVSPRKTFGERMSMLALLMNIGPLMAIPLSGILFTINTSFPFYAAASAELATVLIGLFLIPETVHRKRPHKVEATLSTSIRDYQSTRPKNIWADLFTRRGLIVANVYTFSEDFFEKTVGSVVLPYFALILGISAFWYSMFMGIAALLRMVLYLPLGALSDRIGRKKPIMAGLLLKGVPLLGFPLFVIFPAIVPFAWWGVLGLKCIDGAGDAFTGGPERALVMDWTFSRYERGKAQSINEATQALGGTLGKPLTGWIIEISSVISGFVFGAVGLISAAIFVLFAYGDPPQQKDEK